MNAHTNGMVQAFELVAGFIDNDTMPSADWFRRKAQELREPAREGAVRAVRLDPTQP